MHTTLGLQCKSHLSGLHVSCPPFSGEGSCYGIYMKRLSGWLCPKTATKLRGSQVHNRPKRHFNLIHLNPPSALNSVSRVISSRLSVSQGLSDSSILSYQPPHGSPERGPSACTRRMLPYLSIASPEQSTWTVRGCNLFWPSTL